MKFILIRVIHDFDYLIMFIDIMNLSFNRLILIMINIYIKKLSYLIRWLLLFFFC
jgi:hypothetical protein